MKRVLTLILTLAVIFTADAAYRVGKIKSPKGTTLSGIVYCGNSPLAGVQVSDGEQIVVTDQRGIYNMQSTKPYGVVFITTPSGYKPVMMDKVRPGFWARCVEPATKKERFDFELEKVDDSRFSVIMLSDTHFCDDSRRDDLKHFKKMVMPTIINAAKDGGEEVMSVCLGDITWDRFWYATGFDIEKVPQHLIDNKYPVPFYCVHGNHDYDPSVPSDENPNINAIQRFSNTFGPTFYAMNKGGVHFVFLDNIVYKNEVKKGQKKAKGVVGSRNYDLYILDEQIEWLKKDLQSVDKATPIVVSMHAPLFTYNQTGEQVYGFADGKAEQLVDILKEFESVKIFSGHSHRTMSFVHPQYPNIVEYNITAVAGDLWNTPNSYGINIGEDGADAGVYLCTFEGKNFSKRWYSAEKGSEYPFRAYDMNKVAEVYAQSKELQHLCSLQSRQVNYADEAYRDYIYVNCWAWEEGAKLSIAENGVELNVEKVEDSDPLAAKVVFAKPSILKSDKESAKTNRLSIAANMFRAKCSEENSTITITFTTPDGQVYAQTLERPILF